MDTVKLQLPEVTICAADSAFVDLTARALTRSMAHGEFGDAILFSDVAREGRFRHVRIPPLDSVGAYSRFCLGALADFIETKFVLIVQWDGYVVNPQAWARAFMKYDYIGGAWHGLFPEPLMVGNGGFSLRSRKLLKAVQKLPSVGGHWEDRVICHAFRPTLESQFGIRFAPVKIADRFSYEEKVPETLSFGFHGVQHLWRHTDDEELLSIATVLQFEKLDKDKVLRMVMGWAENDRPKSARALYARMKKRHSEIILRRVLTSWMGPDAADRRMAYLDGKP